MIIAKREREKEQKCPTENGLKALTHNRVVLFVAMNADEVAAEVPAAGSLTGPKVSHR